MEPCPSPTTRPEPGTLAFIDRGGADGADNDTRGSGPEHIPGPPPGRAPGAARAQRVAPVLGALGAPCLVAAATALITALRVRPATWDSLYFEDGWLFLARWGTDGARSIIEPYGGYLHLIPRLVSGVVYELVPVADWGRAVTVAACVVVGLLCALTWSVSAGLVRHRTVRVALALAPALSPATGLQVLGNLNCLHTYCLVAMTVWLCAAVPVSGSRPTSRGRRRAVAVGTALVALVLTLTEVQVLVLAPLVAWVAVGAVRRRDAAGLGLVLGWCLGAAGQAAAVLTQHRVKPFAHAGSSALDVVHGLLVNVVLAPVTSTYAQADDGVNGLGWAGLAVVLALLVLVAVMAARGAEPGTPALQRWAPVVWVALAVGLWLLACRSNGGVPSDPEHTPIPWRWGVAGALLVTDSLLVALDRLRGRALRAIGLAVVLVVALLGFRAPMVYRVGQEPWSVAVSQARAEQCVGTAATARVPQWPAPHVVRISCERLG